MAASRLSSLVAAAAMAASYSAVNPAAYADSPFRFSPFSSSAPSSSAPPEAETSGPDPHPAAEVSKREFDPESLERGAKALREINSSPHAKQVRYFWD